MKVNFILTGEGSSDLRLADHIENILINSGIDEVSGEAPDLSFFKPPVGRSIKEKLPILLKLYPNTDVIFIHRDADNTSIPIRKDEIYSHTNEFIDAEKIIPIIPVTMLETWLLADQDAIKRVAGNNDPSTQLQCLPKIRHLESIKDAKSKLMEALIEASNTQGERLRKFKQRFNEMRARLTCDLDPSGPVSQLDSYKYFRECINDFVQRFALFHADS